MLLPLVILHSLPSESIAIISYIIQRTRSLAFLAELLTQLAVLALLHFQNFFELLRQDEVVHPAVDYVFAEVAVRWEWVLLVERHVVELLVGLEELLLVETD